MTAPLRVVPTEEPDPPYPAEIRSRGFTFEVDWERIEQSDTWTLCPPHVRPWLLMMWARSWQSSPCGTWPDNDLLIAARIGMEDRQFKANRDILMRGWYRSSDGRLYHPVIVEFVLRMCNVRVKDANRMAEWRNRTKSKQGLSVKVTSESHVSHAQSHVSHATATPSPPPPFLSDDSSNHPRQPTLSPDIADVAERAKRPRSGLPPCPYAEIVGLYHDKLPTLPAIRLTSGKTWVKRQRAMREIWELALTTKTSDGSRRAENAEQALEWIGKFFIRASENDFIMGRTKRSAGHEGWRADFDFLLSDSGTKQVIEKTEVAA